MATSFAQNISPAAGVRPVYAIFEGGGAKGITHIGAIKALENEGKEIAGVAGSSAGAIIAALMAVGYKADEIFAPDNPHHLLSKFDKTPVDLLGRWAWRRFKFLRAMLVPLGLAMLTCAIGGMVLLHTHRPWGMAAVVCAMLICLLIVGPIIPAFRARGFFNNDDLKDILDELLRDKLATYLPHGTKLDPARPIRFRDIDPTKIGKCASLKIIVSNARSGQLVIFDHRTPDVVIADAVAASAAIPFVFRSPSIKGHTIDGFPIFVDGGLVSNLPVWSFLSEKRALERLQGGPPIPIIAFSLDEASPAPPARPGTRNKPGRPGIGAYLAAVIRTGIFGSQRLAKDFVADLVMISLPSPLRTLQFDCTRLQAIKAYHAGLTTARAALSKRDRVDEVTTRVLESIVDWAETQICTAAVPSDNPRLRICLVDPVGNNPDNVDPIDDRATTFRIVARARMDQSTDDRLELDQRNDLAPTAFSKRSVLLGKIAQRSAKDLMMTKYEHALVCRSVDSVICIPVMAKDSRIMVPERVLCLDSTGPLQPFFNDPKFMSTLQTLSLAASRSLIEQQIGG